MAVVLVTKIKFHEFRIVNRQLSIYALHVYCFFLSTLTHIITIIHWTVINKFAFVYILKIKVLLGFS